MPSLPGTPSGQVEFNESCADYNNYPSNLCRCRLTRTGRQNVIATWDREAKNTFDDDESVLKFAETCNCSEMNIDTAEPSPTSSNNQATQTCQCQPQLRAIKNLESLTTHLGNNAVDPKVRYVSIQSRSSRDPLMCSQAMFKKLCTYQQIPPSVLDCIYSFKAALSSYDYGLAMFKDDNTLLARQEHTLALDHLGRSGREIRYSFLLRSVESSKSIKGRPWGIRQLAVYHSFDIITGRSFWLTCKGNSAIENNINDTISNDPAFKPNALRSVPEAFTATFDILSMILDWCDENWRWYINAMVDEVMAKAEKAKAYRIADEQDFKELGRRLTHKDQSKNLKQRRSSSIDLECGIRLQSCIRALSSKNTKPDGQSLSHIEGAVQELENLNIFSFQELQELQSVLERIQEALLVLKLNHQVIRQIRDHYQALMHQYKIPEMKRIQSECRNSFLQLCRHSKSVEGSIETRQAQLDSLHVLVQENKTLYEAILQYKSIQINTIYADSAQSSAYNMEIIANKTKRETTSMHVITFVTLIFLPATFMASFFQSGILEWPDLDLEPGDGHHLHGGIFGLFMGLSIAMTAFIVLIWFLVSRKGRGQVNTGA